MNDDNCHETISHQVGAMIKDLRQQRGWTQRDLAGEDMSPGFISQVERGKTSPSLASLETIAQRLDVSVAELFPSEGDEVNWMTEAPQILLQLTRAHLLMDEGGEAQKYLTKAEQIWEETDPPDEQLTATHHLWQGLLALQTGDVDLALTEITDASEIFDHLPRQHEGSLECLLSLGEIHLMRKNHLLAVRFFDAALKRTEDRADVTRTQRFRMLSEWGLGRAYLYMGELETAHQFFRRAMTSAKGLTDLQRLVRAAADECVSCLNNGHLEDARSAAARAASLSAFQFIRRIRAQILQHMGQVSEILGDRKKAISYLDRAEAVAEDIGEEAIAAESFLLRGRINLRQQDIEAAAFAADRILSMLDPESNASLYGRASLLAGRAAAQRNDTARAKEHFRTAEDCFRQAGNLSLLARTQRELGQIYMQEGKHDQALRYFHRSSDLFSQLSTPTDDSPPV